MTSKPTKGDIGVFVVNITSVTDAVIPTDLKAKQKEVEQMNSYSVDNELYQALKDKANIEDHRGKFGF
jgi:peptidyl-prolyl cis-trans isomerase D